MGKIKGMTDYSKYFNTAKDALKKKKKSTDHRGLNTKQNYSSFWMDDEWDSKSKFAGIGQTSHSSDLVKLVKLSNYRRAVTNFVKILTNKDIPVYWAGSGSYTDGKQITLSTDIKDNNFDVTVGLALHESSHVLLTNWDILPTLMNHTCPKFRSVHSRIPSGIYDMDEFAALVKSLLNWIEDRRIDNFVFKTSPGYKAYYHKMYDYYWNSKDVTKGFIAEEFRDPSKEDSYMFHIINMISPLYNSTVLPDLDTITKMIDVRNIGRLSSTDECYDIALEVAVIIANNIKAAEKLGKINGTDGTNGQGGNGSGNTNSSDDTSGGEDEGQGEDNGEDGGNTITLTSSELNDLMRKLQEQKRFGEGMIDKKSASKKMQRDLDRIAKESIEIQVINDGLTTERNCLMYDMTKSNRLNDADELQKQMEDFENTHPDYWRLDGHRELRDKLDAVRVVGFDRSVRDEYKDSIKNGSDMGSLLGKKLQLHNESRERVDTRLRSGKIDAKRLAHAGYGIEGIFKQIHVDKYKKANLHITLDGSGSMSGKKWESTIQMTMAIAKAATYTQNINVQVSIRSTGDREAPIVYYVYDSRKNKINQLITAFNRFSPCSMTPEGLCFEAMLKKGMLLASDNDLDSYILNISDGEPSCSGYSGSMAHQHTKRQVDKMRNELSISVLSFFLDSTTDYSSLLESFANSHSGRAFKTMYGKDASAVDCNSTLQIAKELNNKFLAKSSLK